MMNAPLKLRWQPPSADFCVMAKSSRLVKKVTMATIQVIDCYAKPVEPESCEALDTLDYSDKNAGEVDFLPNYLSG